jgi:hypothetical protein
MVSHEWDIIIDVTYDPPVASDTLVDQKVKVGAKLFYSTPGKSKER